MKNTCWIYDEQLPFERRTSEYKMKNWSSKPTFEEKYRQTEASKNSRTNLSNDSRRQSGRAIEEDTNGRSATPNVLGTMDDGLHQRTSNLKFSDKGTTPESTDEFCNKKSYCVDLDHDGFHNGFHNDLGTLQRQRTHRKSSTKRAL